MARYPHSRDAAAGTGGPGLWVKITAGSRGEQGASPTHPTCISQPFINSSSPLQRGGAAAGPSADTRACGSEICVLGTGLTLPRVYTGSSRPRARLGSSIQGTTAWAVLLTSCTRA